MIRRGTARILLLWLLSSATAGCALMGGVPSASARPTETMLDRIQAVAARPDYMTVCKSIFGSGPATQADFLGVRPVIDGTTEAIQQLGPPTEIRGTDAAEWYYTGFVLTVRNRTVESIYVGGAGYLERSLETILSDYGCPDLIFGIDSAEEPSGTYSVVDFVFGRAGTRVLFQALPVSLDAKPSDTEYFSPGKLQSVVERLGYQNYSPQAGSPLDWNAAVQP